MNDNSLAKQFGKRQREKHRKTWNVDGSKVAPEINKKNGHFKHLKL